MSAAADARGRRPESVIVVVVRDDGQTLMLERADWPGFWQSVTGGVEWGETRSAAAHRELLEETGLHPEWLRCSGIMRRFEIFPEYRHKYPAHIRFNDEHEFIAQVDGAAAVRISPREHSAWRWMRLSEAIGVTPSWSNRLALRQCGWALGLT